MKRFIAKFLPLLLMIISSVFSEDKFVYIPLSVTTAIGVKHHFFEDELAKYGYKVKVVDISNTSIAGATIAMLDRGDLNFTTSMAYMATDYRLNGFKTKVIWAAQPTIRKSVLVFVKNDSPYRKIGDLKGQTIGTIRYCCGYAAALEIFQHAGYPIDTDLKKGDVRVWISPSSTNSSQALLAGRIQGISDHIQSAAHANAFLQGLTRVLDTLPDNSIYQRFGGRQYLFGSVKWIDAHPQLAQAIAKGYDKATVYQNAHRDEASQVQVSELRSQAGVAKFQNSLEWSTVAPSERSYDKVVESLKQVQIQYKNLGEPLYVRKTLSDKDLAEFVDKRFFEGGQYSAFN